MNEKFRESIISLLEVEFDKLNSTIRNSRINLLELTKEFDIRTEKMIDLKYIYNDKETLNLNNKQYITNLLKFISDITELELKIKYHKEILKSSKVLKIGESNE